MKIRLYFKWFDFWVGWFFDTKKKILYIGVLPMVGVKIELQANSEHSELTNF